MKDVRILRLMFYGLLFLVLLFGVFACKKMEGEKEKIQTSLDKPLPSDAFKAGILIEDQPTAAKANSNFYVKAKVRNMSNSLWPAKGQPGGAYSINFAYHWLDKDGRVIVWDGIRTPLPHDIKPGEEVTLNASVKSPDKPGDYILEFDMVQERVAWFSKKGETKAVRLAIKVD